MNFLTQQQEVAAQLAMDLSESDKATLIQRWLNITQQDICGRWPWQFLYSEEIIQTKPDETAGTVSVTAGGTTVTGTNTAFLAADVGNYIQFQGNLEWYLISAVTPSTSLTINTAYNGSTNLVDGTYIIRKFYYSLSSSADAIISVRNMNTPLMLYETDLMTFDEILPNTNSTGNTSMFIAYGYDSSGNIRLTPYPYPSDKRNLQIRTLKRVTDLSLPADISIIPVKWHHVMIFGAIGLGYMWKKQIPESDSWVRKYEGKIEDMIHKERISEEDTPVLNSVDSGRRTTMIPFPSNFPRM